MLPFRPLCGATLEQGGERNSELLRQKMAFLQGLREGAPDFALCLPTPTPAARLGGDFYFGAVLGPPFG